MNETLIHLFESVRDIPYRIPLAIDEPDMCCTGKAMQLKSLLEQEGLDVRYRVCEFRWSDFVLPHHLIDIPHDDVSTHAYLEVRIDDAWVAVDPTWDKALRQVFSIAEWDGERATLIAVHSINTFDPETSRQIIESPSEELIENDLAINGEFYRAFNEWLEEERVGI